MISCSVGIAIYPDGCSHAKLIARADAAMYASKRSGGSKHCFYSSAMDADAEAQFELLRDLRKAVAAKEFELFYQPKIDAKSGKVTAVEALLRWKHPARGLLLPSTFIPIAERFGLIGAIGNWVIEDACRQSRQWREKGVRMRVAINLSAHQMRQDDIVERITDALQAHKIHPSLLTCEITESAAMEDTKTTQTTFRRLGELGTHLSIDDFGTGYSSLSYLRKLPAEELKIDRSFIQDLEHSADARAVVDAVIKLAHALGLKVVAEGVENQRQQQVLVQMGCDELQGFLFAKPMSARALMLWAVNDRSEGASVFKPSLFDETRQSDDPAPDAAPATPGATPRPAPGAPEPGVGPPGGPAELSFVAVGGGSSPPKARFVASRWEGADGAPYIHVQRIRRCASSQGAHHVRQHLLRCPDLQPPGRWHHRGRVGDGRAPSGRQDERRGPAADGDRGRQARRHRRRRHPADGRRHRAPPGRHGGRDRRHRPRLARPVGHPYPRARPPRLFNGRPRAAVFFACAGASGAAALQLGRHRLLERVGAVGEVGAALVAQARALARRRGFARAVPAPGPGRCCACRPGSRRRDGSAAPRCG